MADYTVLAIEHQTITFPRFSPIIKASAVPFSLLPAVGVCMVLHPHHFVPPASVLGLLLAGGSKWFQRVQLVSALSRRLLKHFACEVVLQGRVSLPDSASAGWCTIAPGNGGMRRFLYLHLQPWGSPTLRSWWWRSSSDLPRVQWDRLLTWPLTASSFFLCQILALFHISLGQQLNLYWVHKVQWFAQVQFVPVTPNKSWHPLCLLCPARLECWLHCWPQSLASSLSMTSGAVSGTSCWFRCRYVFLFKQDKTNREKEKNWG